MTGVRPLTWVLRAMVALLPLAGLLCTIGAGEGPPAWLMVVVVVVAVGWALVPESAAGFAVLLIVLLWWGIGLRQGLDPWALPAAASVLGAHVSALLLSYGPASLMLDLATVRLWLRRAAIVYLAAPLTFGLAVWVRDAPVPAGMWAVGLAAAFGALLAASLVLSVYGQPEAET